MRVLTLVTAALAALVIASVTPAAAQGSFNKIRDLCPDLSSTQIKGAIPGLVDQYEFSNDQDEAAMQAASLLCSYAGDIPTQQEADVREASMVQQAVVAPPPHFNGPKPHFNGPVPHFNGPNPTFSHNGMPPRRFAPPRLKVRPGYHPPPRLLPPPPGGHAHGRPLPRAAVVAGAGSYGHQYREEAPRALRITKSIKGPPYCLAVRDGAEAYEAKYPRPHANCEIAEVPGAPCPGWACRRSSR